MNTLEKFVDYCNNNIITPNKYYVRSSGNEIVVSNVPDFVYSDKRIFQYKIPKPIASNSVNKFIDFLKGSIDFLQNNQPDGEFFYLNRCFDNSKALFMYLSILASNGNISLKNTASIVIGHVVTKVPYGVQLGDIFIDVDNIVMHDLHSWCMVNDFIIDLSLFSNGNKIKIGDHVAWGTAHDHVFLYPPPNTEYSGIQFYDLKSTNEYLSTIFGAQYCNT